MNSEVDLTKQCYQIWQKVAKVAKKCYQKWQKVAKVIPRGSKGKCYQMWQKVAKVAKKCQKWRKRVLRCSNYTGLAPFA